MPQTRKNPLGIIWRNLIIQYKNLELVEVLELFVAKCLFA